MPEANRLTLHIPAAVAECIREALTAAKARGQKLGNPNPAPAAAQARAVAEAQLDTYRASVRPIIAERISRS